MSFDSFIAAGVEEGAYGTIDDTGYLKGDGASAPDAGDPAGSGMGSVRGLTGADVAIPAPDVVNIDGDDISQGSFGFPSNANPAFNLDKSVFNLVQDAIMQKTKTFSEGGITFGVLKPNKNDPEDTCWILQSPTKKKDIGLNGLKAWSGYWVPLTQAFPQGRQAFANRAGAADRYRIVSTPADMLPNGVMVDTANFDTEGGCVFPFTNQYPIYGHRWTGDGTEDTFLLPFAPAEYNADQIIIRVNGVVQTWGTAYHLASGLSVAWQSGHIPAEDAKVVALIGYKP